MVTRWLVTKLNDQSQIWSLDDQSQSWSPDNQSQSGHPITSHKGGHPMTGHKVVTQWPVTKLITQCPVTELLTRWPVTKLDTRWPVTTAGHPMTSHQVGHRLSSSHSYLSALNFEIIYLFTSTPFGFCNLQNRRLIATFHEMLLSNLRWLKIPGVKSSKPEFTILLCCSSGHVMQ